MSIIDKIVVSCFKAIPLLVHEIDRLLITSLIGVFIEETRFNVVFLGAEITGCVVAYTAAKKC
ncbi:MAG: hypothetical protein ACFFD4_23880 [Candidatus Odinarchaeota archaeon]